jgi:hypothetical protein
VLAAPAEDVHNEAFNVGADSLNHQVRDLAAIAANAVGDCSLEILSQADADQRTYKTDFGKFARTFGDFEFEWTAEKGARELSDGFRSIGLTETTFGDKRFTRLKWLSHLLDTGRLDESLRWRPDGDGEGTP